MAATTTYDVRLNLSLTDRLTPGVRKQTSELARLQKQARSTSGTLDKLAKAAVTGFGVKFGFEWLVKYNAEVDDLKRKLSTIIMLNTGGDWTRAFGMASDLTLKLREDAKLSAGTMQDMVGFAAAIANPVLAAGGNMQQLRDFTRQAVVAAAALGERADLAQLDITQALQGTLSAKDRFARALLSPMGIGHLEFNALSGKKRFETLLTALNDPAIKAAAKSYEDSFSGVTSTLKDNFQQLGGTIGTELFKAITKQVIEVNGWLTKNKALVDDFAHGAGRFLKDAFDSAKRAVMLIAEHRDLLMALAKAFLVGKGISLLTGPLGGLGKLAAAAGGASGKVAAFGQALGALPAAMGIVGGAFALATAGRRNILDREQVSDALVGQARDVSGRRVAGQLETAAAHQMGFGGGDLGAQTFRAHNLLTRARELGVVGARGGINQGRLLDVALGASDGGKKTVEDLKRGLAEANKFAAQIYAFEVRRLVVRGAAEAGMTAGHFMAQKLFAASKQFSDFMASAFARSFAGIPVFGQMFKSPLAALKTPKPADLNVDKIVIEVQSSDPDRFYMGLEGYLQDLVRSPSGTPASFREGR